MQRAWWLCEGSSSVLCAALPGVCGFGSLRAVIYPLHATHFNRFSKNFGHVLRRLFQDEGISVVVYFGGHIQRWLEEAEEWGSHFCFLRKSREAARGFQEALGEPKFTQESGLKTTSCEGKTSSLMLACFFLTGETTQNL